MQKIKLWHVSLITRLCRSRDTAAQLQIPHRRRPLCLATLLQHLMQATQHRVRQKVANDMTCRDRKWPLNIQNATFWRMKGDGKQ